MLIRKSKFFLMAGIAALCISCSDDSNSINANDVAGKDDDKIITPNPNMETTDGATFETKGKGSYGDDLSIKYDSYRVDAMVATSYDGVEAPADAAPRGIADEYTSVDYEIGPGGYDGDFGGEYGGGYNGKTYGLLTASEWNDLDNWSAWGEILTGEFSTKTSYWKFYPHTLVAVQVVDENGTGLANVSVELLNNDKVEFATKTDNSGNAYCWVRLFEGYTEEALNSEDFSLKINGDVSENPVKITHKYNESLEVNVVTSDAKQADAKADVAFIVDATGSRGDEIRFLQSDLSYIIDHASSETLPLTFNEKSSAFTVSWSASSNNFTQQ